MSLLKNIFGSKAEPVKSYKDFWDWFQKNEKAFFKVVKKDDDVQKGFLDKLGPKLNELKEGFFYLTGMFDDDTAELIITPDGEIKNIVFAEEIVNAAPAIKGWKFTALKPALDVKDVNIEMDGFKFNQENIHFYANENAGFPDEVDITFIHDDWNEDDKGSITNGVCIFLDNFLGELNFVTSIDTFNVIGKDEAAKELIPVQKLKDYLLWRSKEFVEKYDDVRHDTENDNYTGLEAKFENGNPLFAVINTDLLAWDSKASHPWILTVEIKYDGKDNNGMPDDNTLEMLEEIEDGILAELKDFDGYLNIGRQTADNVREIYFACKDFRKPSKVLHSIQEKYAKKIKIDFDIYKDKYWQSFDRFGTNYL